MRLLYFAWVREAIGMDGEDVVPPAGVTDVAGLVGWLATADEAHAAAFGDLSRLRFAIDQGFVAADAPIAGTRELAIFPPVTGG